MNFLRRNCQGVALVFTETGRGRPPTRTYMAASGWITIPGNKLLKKKNGGSKLLLSYCSPDVLLSVLPVVNAILCALVCWMLASSVLSLLTMHNALFHCLRNFAIVDCPKVQNEAAYICRDMLWRTVPCSLCAMLLETCSSQRRVCPQYERMYIYLRSTFTMCLHSRRDYSSLLHWSKLFHY